MYYLRCFINIMILTMKLFKYLNILYLLQLAVYVTMYSWQKKIKPQGDVTSTSTFYRWNCPVSESADGGAPDVTRGAEEHVGVVLGLHPVQGRHWRSYFYNGVIWTIIETKDKLLTE